MILMPHACRFLHLSISWFEIYLATFRLGFLIDFLSHAAVVGFMAGAAITIALQQLKGLLGIQNFTKKTDIVSVMRSVWSTVHHGVTNETCFFSASKAPRKVNSQTHNKNFLLFLLPVELADHSHRSGIFGLPSCN